MDMPDAELPDDLEVEITDLDQTSAAGQSVPTLSRSPLTPCFSLRQRIVQLIVTVSVVTLSMLMILGGYPAVRDVAVRVFPSPVPTSTLAPGVDLFYFDASPSWGHLFIDGKLVPHLPVFHIDRPTHDPPLQLTRGHHLLDWRADPFQEQRCTVSVPPNFATDTCRFTDTVQQVSGLVPAWVIKFSVSLTAVPLALRSSLIQQVQTALDRQQSTETVQVGEEYAPSSVEHGGVRARQPLKATLHLQLDTNAATDAFCTGLGPIGPRACDCLTFCTAQWLASSFSSLIPSGAFPPEWDVLAVVRSTWTYTTMDGKLVATDQPDASGSATGLEHLAPFRIFWDGTQWYATTLFTGPNEANTDITDPICASARDDVQLTGPLNQLPPSGTIVDWSFVSGSDLAAGCLAIATPEQSPLVTPSSSQPIAYCLHRFGVFVAVNDVAHKFWPDMPLADAYEQGIAQHLLMLFKNAA